MIKKNGILALLLLIAPQAHPAPSAVITEEPPIIPLPISLQAKKDQAGFALSNGLGAGKYAQLLEAIFDGTNVKISDRSKDITLTKDTALPPEGYRLSVNPNGISIRYSTKSGLVYALQTLSQSVVNDAKGDPAFPAMEVYDYPRFGWRGVMIDSGRHMMPAEDIKKALRLMGRYKLNTLHWHLTDNQGWRIESKKYPKLNLIGSYRAQSPVIGDKNKGDGTPYGGYYTQQEIKDIVAYADKLGITIVPEIETPGHAGAATASYPEFGNKDIPDYNPKVMEFWGRNHYIFSPTEETFQFLDGIISEVCELFPNSPYIHMGGDEAPKSQWKASPQAQAVMKQNNLKNEEELQSYFMRRVEKIVNRHGKKMIGWDEINEGGLSPTATMMVWRDWKWAKFALAQGNNIIMCPVTHLYLDFGQGPSPQTPEYEYIHSEKPGSTIIWQKVYSLNPVPEGTPDSQLKQILGVQGNFWSEYIPNMAKWEYMAFPRVIALSEVAWTPLELKEEAAFEARLKKHLPYLDRLKVNYRTLENGDPARPNAVISRKRQKQ